MFSPPKGILEGHFTSFLHWKGTLGGALSCFLHQKGTLEGTIPCFLHQKGTKTGTLSCLMYNMANQDRVQTLESTSEYNTNHITHKLFKS